MRWGNVLMGSSNKRRTSSIRDWTYTFFSIYKFPAKLQSNVRLFAGDTIVYMAVTNETNAAMLQKDLKLLEEWKNRSQMFFHPDKSHGAGSPSPMITSYTTRSLRKKRQLNILASLYTISCLGK